MRLASRLLIVSFDGLRPDLALRADMPTLRGLMKDGSFSFWARTTEMAVTLPSHTSMLTGLIPAKHGITFNDTQVNQFPKVPTLMTLAKQAGYTTAVVAGKQKFITLAQPGAVDWNSIEDQPLDVETAKQAVRMIAEHQPEVLFVHLAGIDYSGHALGWGTDEQIAAIEEADRALALILKRLKDSNLYHETVILLTADHGGAGRTHGPDDSRSRHIPWIISGPNIRKNYDLTLDPQLVINTEDTFATACWILGIAAPEGIDGKAIATARGAGELMRSLENNRSASMTEINRKGLSYSYANPYASTQPTTSGAGGYKLSTTLPADFAVAADICGGVSSTNPSSMPAMMPSIKVP